MPTRSPGDAPAGTIETLGLPTRAVTALTRAGITDVAALAALSRRELAAVPGLGAGLVTAIRRVVPEPPTPLPRSGTAARDGQLSLPAEEDGAPDAPEIPSFASLRDPRRRSGLDLLVPGAPAPEQGTAPGPQPEAEATPPTSAPRRAARPAPAPRPAEYADLLRLGMRAARAAVTVPGRLALWSVRTQVDWLRRLLGT
ncbi:DNA-directed RNA polymerase subunit alpha C-terminal domain-containing protein [Geodermatophilus sp. SYSU D00710]